jgi:hypothetical protein
VRLTLNEESAEPGNAWATRLEVVLRDGRTLNAEGNGFRGAPDTPMSDAELDAKFLALSASLGEGKSRRLLDGLHRLGDCNDVAALASS